MIGTPGVGMGVEVVEVMMEVGDGGAVLGPNSGWQGESLERGDSRAASKSTAEGGDFLSPSLSLSLSLCLSLYLSVCLCVCVCLSVCLCVCACARVCVSTCMYYKTLQD